MPAVPPARRLLTVGHSYAVGPNRRLAHELACAGGGRWAVTTVGPLSLPGDLRPVRLTVTAADAPARLEAVPMRWAASPHLRLYGSRLRALLADRWDVVHAWEEPFVLAGGQAAWWTPPTARLVFATFQNLPKRYPPPFAQVERYAMRRAAGWVAWGHTAAATLQDRPGYRDRPHRVIPVGVDVDRFRPDPAARPVGLRRFGWDADGPPVVGFVGRLVPEKGLPVLTDALDRVGTGWRAVVVGTGPLERTVRRWENRHPCRVRLLTDVTHEAMPGVLAGLDLMAVPSLTTPRWKEQFGRVLVEAMAAGVPVVASDSGEIPHVVGDAGRLVPEGDVPAWAAALGELLDDPAARAALARRGRARAEARFAWPVVARQHLAFFEELLSS